MRNDRCGGGLGCWSLKRPQDRETRTPLLRSSFHLAQIIWFLSDQSMVVNGHNGYLFWRVYCTFLTHCNRCIWFNIIHLYNHLNIVLSQTLDSRLFCLILLDTLIVNECLHLLAKICSFWMPNKRCFSFFICLRGQLASEEIEDRPVRPCHGACIISPIWQVSIWRWGPDSVASHSEYIYCNELER